MGKQEALLLLLTSGVTLASPVPGLYCRIVLFTRVHVHPYSGGQSPSWLISYPGSLTAQQITDLFIQHVFWLHGLPSHLSSDWGLQFLSKFWQTKCRRMGMLVLPSSAYHSLFDGQTKRTNQTLEQYLRCYTMYSQMNGAPYYPLWNSHTTMPSTPPPPSTLHSLQITATIHAVSPI